jgi:DNA adenine methylase
LEEEGLSLSKCNESHAKPFLRWAGGKTRLMRFLDNHLPPDLPSDSRYYEPFLGAGSLFFRLEPQRATLSDNNKDLIDCFRAVRKRPDLVSEYLKQHFSNSCEKYYYKMREKYNTSKPSVARAALFIYLNKTCFNGIWRVNMKGQFNVPYGFKEPPFLPSKDQLSEISKVLTRAEILWLDYKEIEKSIKQEDFVYFDPPYPPLNGTSNFTHYTTERFTKKDHYELACIAKLISNRGCYLLISNADTPYIRSLYEDDFNIFELEVTRWIRTDGKRYKAKEIAITNYDV